MCNEPRSQKSSKGVEVTVPADSSCHPRLELGMEKDVNQGFSDRGIGEVAGTEGKCTG